MRCALSDQTVRDLVTLAVEWLSMVDAMTVLVGNDAWQDMDVEEFARIAETGNPFAQVVLWNALESTRQQIEGLPEAGAL